MGFKFLGQNIPDEPETVEGAYDRFNQLVNNQLILSVDNRPAVFLNLNRGRATISDDEWSHILQQQRRFLIEDMWERGMIIQTVISEDMNGFSLRTEINF